MTHEEFNSLLERRLELTRKVLASKSKEYSTGGDKLHNFKAAARLRGERPEDSLLGMLVKHWVSIQDLVAARSSDQDYMPSRQLLDEKIGDAINYLILLEAVLTEERK